MKFVNKKNINKISVSILGILLVTGCSSDEDSLVLNSRVQDGMVVLGSDPVIDNEVQIQKEVSFVTKKNVLKAAEGSDKISNDSKSKQSTSYRAELRENLHSLNKKLLKDLKFGKDGKVAKTKITKRDLNDLIELYSIDMESILTEKQSSRLSKYVVGALKSEPKYQEKLADFYLDGFNRNSYEQLAVSWYLIAAGKGSTYSKYMISILYQLGVGLPQDLGESVAWYKKASQAKDSSSAKIQVAKKYLSPTSVVHDPKQAFVWMESAAMQGNVEAQYLLADMYLQGNGVDKSEMDALSWYGKAAQQNSAYAQYSLGVMFYNGQGSEQNLLEAKKWLKYAALQGHHEAQYLLGRMYEQGFGVEKSLPRAYAWWMLIPNDGILAENFSNKLDKVITSMTPKEMASAKKLAQDYKKKVGVG